MDPWGKSLLLVEVRTWIKVLSYLLMKLSVILFFLIITLCCPESISIKQLYGQMTSINTPTEKKTKSAD